ncbi:S41 family peptidase [Pseudochryseolinea flava]|uniref:Tail specific protease domain-containing protein n=1 Tax=Pseudochryseolinea flava TaxID=2059302 RepID=A0A364Y6Y2_9BACT|nr:S41 family peptidase [Pseudochryseolinea flava]RAW02700.1 hypothetical protein DQQ10_00910 [Pseudochryseolinea flava]
MNAIKIYFKRTTIILICCTVLMAAHPPKPTPTENFEYFWKTFDTHYGLFGVKHVNWVDVYNQFKPRVHDSMTDEALYALLSEMITLLNDNHLNLYPTNGDLPAFPGGILRYVNGKLTILKAQEDYDLDVVKKYLTNYHEATGSVRYGILPDNIGYITITSHGDSRKDIQQSMTTILGALKDTRGMIIDVRGDYGGHDAIAQLIAGYFTAEEKLYMITKKKNGPAHDDFTRPEHWTIAPKTKTPYLKPTIVLTSRFTQSAGETFTLALRELSHVKIMGDTTAGSFSDNPTTEMPNGWMFTVSIGDYRDARGKSFEGIGIAPDEFIRTTKEDLLQGKDVALEAALKKFQ